MKKRHKLQKPFDPSPLEIWRRCSVIQATWTADEERKRRGVSQEQWNPPRYKRASRIRASSRFENQ